MCATRGRCSRSRRARGKHGGGAEGGTQLPKNRQRKKIAPSRGSNSGLKALAAGGSLQQSLGWGQQPKASLELGVDNLETMRIAGGQHLRFIYAMKSSPRDQVLPMFF